MFKISITRRRAVLGSALALLSFVAFCGALSTKKAIFLAVLLLIAGCFKVETDKTKVQVLLHVVWCIGAIFLTYLAICMLCTICYRPSVVALNALCIGLFVFALLIFSGNIRLSVVLGTLATMLLATANYYVYQFRGREMFFADFQALTTAMSVASQYSFKLTSELIYSWAVWAIIPFSCRCLPTIERIAACSIRLAGASVFAVMALLLPVCSSKIELRTWNREGSEMNGFLLNLYLSCRDGIPEKPENYGSEAVERLADMYEQQDSEAENKPNIIVIMSEAYSDLSVLGNNLRTNIPVTPFFDSLSENVVCGYALCSVFGGNTANSEFEFLTGMTMANLPEGSVPYQQFISGNTFSLAWAMQELGYQCYSTHPYHARGWSRPTVYPRIGVEDSTFLDAYPQKNLIRNYVSDWEMYTYILDHVKDSTNDDPFFLFGITMQNHGGYSYVGDNFTQIVELEGYSEEYPLAEQYLSLLHESDLALEYLLSELSEHPEDTLVLFFGDHLPKIEQQFLEEVHGGPFISKEDWALQYTVPFFIWANYDIQEETIERTSLNYLGLYLLEAAGLPLPEYFHFLSDMRQVIPAMNIHGYYSKTQGGFISYEESTGTEADWLNRYAVLQYNSLFDPENRSTIFFGQYLPE